MKDIIRIIIVDDDSHTIKALQQILENNLKGVQLIKSYSRPDVFLKDWKIGMPDFDLLFVGVEMTPLNGMELVKEMKKVNFWLDFDIVFLTPNDDLALDDFRYHAIDYLHKPFNAEELQFCLSCWKRKKTPSFEPTQTLSSPQPTHHPDKARNQLAIPTKEGYEIIDIDQIIRCEADRNYTYIHLTGLKQPFLISKNLKDLENALSSHGFLRIHNSHLINPSYVKRILRTDGGMIEMCDNTKIRITKNKAMTVEKLFVNIIKI
jgi:two-component system, LytTR family, response regulator